MQRLTAYVISYLEKMFYILTAVSLHNWRNFGDMRALAGHSEHEVENSGLLFCPSELYTDYNHVSPCISLIHHGIELLFTISVPSLLVVPHQLGSPSISSLDCTSTSLQFQPCKHQYHPVPEMGVDRAPAWDP